MTFKFGEEMKEIQTESTTFLDNPRMRNEHRNTLRDSRQRLDHKMDNILF